VTYSQRVEVPCRPSVGGQGDAPPDHLRAVSGGFDLPFRRVEEGFRQRSPASASTLTGSFSFGRLANVGVLIAAPRERAGEWPKTGLVSRSESEFFRRELMTRSRRRRGEVPLPGDPDGSWRRWNRVSHRLAAAASSRDHHPLKGSAAWLGPGARLGRDGDAYVIRLGDLSAGERRTVFAKVNVPGKGPGLGKSVTWAPVSATRDVEASSTPPRRRFPRTRPRRRSIVKGSTFGARR